MKRGDLLMGILTWLFGGHKEPIASTASTAQSTIVEAPKTKKKTTKKITTKKTTKKKGRGRPKKK